MLAVGIDIGTTSIGLTAIDLDDGIIRERFSAPNVRVDSPHNYAYLQDPEDIGLKVDHFLSRIPTKPISIGITGQVHGILYTDLNGNALSKLYTWLDQRGVASFGSSTPQNDLLKKCGETLPAGYGLLSHYANRKLGLVPKETTHIMGICEYITGRLLKHAIENTDQSCLSSFGGWDPVSKVHHSGLLSEILPPGSPEFLSSADAFELAGITDSGIFVSYPVGDNQSGFFGTVSNFETECLVSIGTSGQLSIFSPKPISIPSMELRPFLGLGFLEVGATLSAGKSYEALEKFILSILKSGGMNNIDDNFVYNIMKTAAETGEETPLKITTTLKGTRKDANLRGSITGIDLDNLNLGNLVRGTMVGIVDELSQFRKDLGHGFSSLSKLNVTGEVVRKNPLFISYLERQFDMEVNISNADASIGAAIIGAISAGIISADDRKPLIKKIAAKNNY